MGVDIQTWAAAVLKNPLRFKFDGLSGFWEDVRKAAVADEVYVYKAIYDEQEYVVNNIREYVEPYTDFLISRLNIQRNDKQLILDCMDPDYSNELLARLEEELGESRDSFACEHVDPQLVQEGILSGDSEHLLEKHPPIEVYNPAYDCGFPLDHVVYICPSCGRQAMTTDELGDNGYRHYCSLCGSDYLDPHDFRDPADLAKFARTFEIALWPFLKQGDVVMWSDPDGNTDLAEVVDAGKAVYQDTIRLKDAAGSDIECDRHEIRQSTVSEFNQFHKEKEGRSDDEG